MFVISCHYNTQDTSRHNGPGEGFQKFRVLSDRAMDLAPREVYIRKEKIYRTITDKLFREYQYGNICMYECMYVSMCVCVFVIVFNP